MQPKIIYLRCVGGELAAASILAKKVGAHGLSPNKIAQDLARATADWKGQTVTCKLTIQNQVAKVEVVPSASNLLLKELKLSPTDLKKVKNVRQKGNLTFEQIIDVARQMRSRSMAKKLEGTVKEILGTAQHIGFTVNGQTPHSICESINNGELKVPEE
uniref:Ribosomal_L11 domain-containing protein n=1 Tax=Steinernema glaseri TaxID=37863 RepID=A0A1I7Z5I0_9BILA